VEEGGELPRALLACVLLAHVYGPSASVPFAGCKLLGDKVLHRNADLMQGYHGCADNRHPRLARRNRHNTAHRPRPQWTRLDRVWGCSGTEKLLDAGSESVRAQEGDDGR
jgi:hypothetical protein